MKRAWWMQFFNPDGGAGGGTSSGGNDPPAGGGNQPNGGEPDGEGGENKDNLKGLKSALEAERKERKELSKKLSELTDKANKGEQVLKELEAVNKKLAGYEFRDTREAALSKAIEAATKDGKFTVDREKAAKLAAKLNTPETLEADLTELVDLLKVEAKDDTTTEQKPGGERRKPIAGQPAKDGGASTTEISPKDWGKLKRENPEAFKAMLKARREKRKFSIPS